MLLGLIFLGSARLGILHLTFPDLSISLWGLSRESTLGQFAWTIAVMTSLFWLIAMVFLCAGAGVGHLFGRLRTLKAYSWDLGGSLAGVVAFAAITFLNAGPHVWFLMGCLPFVVLTRKPVALLCAAATVLSAWLSIGGAIYSPYNRIDVERDDEWQGKGYYLSVNRDFHQFIHDFSPAAFADGVRTQRELNLLRWGRRVYDLPFMISRERRKALIVGGGTGNDVQAALRNGFEEVVSVDIDEQIMKLGRILHAEKPYSDPRVTVVTDDARAFFEQYDGPPFDVVCFSFLDSHAMFSALSTLRLEDFLYTREGIHSAWRHVAPDGILVITFSVFAGDWISDRLYWTIDEATGIEPLVVSQGMHHGNTYIVPRQSGSMRRDALADFSRSR